MSFRCYNDDFNDRGRRYEVCFALAATVALAAAPVAHAADRDVELYSRTNHNLVSSPFYLVSILAPNRG